MALSIYDATRTIKTLYSRIVGSDHVVGHDVLDVVPGTAATNLGKAEDAAHTTGDVGVMALAVRNDAGAALAGATGDYIPLSTDSTGALRTTGSGGTQYAEDAVHGSGDTGTLALAVRKDTAAQIAGTDGDYTALITDASGRLHVVQPATTVGGAASIPAGTNNIGDVDVLSIAAGANAIGNVGLEPRTSGGLSVARYLDLGVTGQVVKGSAGQVFGWRITNQRAGAIYVKIYDKATAATDADTPLLTLALLEGQGETDSLPHGIAFASGISVRATTAIADNSTAAPGTNEAVVNVFYK